MTHIPHPHDADAPYDDSLAEGEAIRGSLHLTVTFSRQPGFMTSDGWEPPGLGMHSMTLAIYGATDDDTVELTDEIEIQQACQQRGVDIGELIDEARQEAREP